MSENPWKWDKTFKGPCVAGPLAGVTDLEYELERKEIFVLGRKVGAYVFIDNQWIWSPAHAR